MTFTYKTLLGLSAGLLILPLWLAPFPTLIDMPDHLARVSILRQLSDSSSPFTAYFHIQWAPVPYLGLEILLLGLMTVLPALTAMKMAVTAILALWIYGCHRLGLELAGGPTWMVIPASLLCYNGMFQYGYLSFCLGAGLYLVLLSLWLRYRKGWTAGRLALLGLWSIVAYFCHLATVMLLAASIGLIALAEFGKSRDFRRLLRDLIPLVPSIALYALLTILIPSGASSLDRTIAWDSPSALVVKLFSPLSGYSLWGMILSVAITLAGVVLAAWSVRFRFWRHAWLGLAMLVLYVATPGYVNDGGDVNTRFLVAAYPLLLLNLQFPAPGEHLSRAARLGLVLLIAGPALHVAGVANHWVRMGGEISGQVNLLRSVEAGARIYPVSWLPEGREQNKRYRHWIHLPHYATVYRNAFLPSNNILPGMHIVQRNSAGPYYRTIERGTTEDRVAWDRILGEYHYLFGCGLNGAYHSRLTAKGELVGQAGDCALYRTSLSSTAR